MQFTIGLFHEGDPELLGVRTIGEKDLLAFGVIGKQGIHGHLFPLTVFKKLESHESVGVEMLGFYKKLFEKFPPFILFYFYYFFWGGGDIL